MQPDLRANRTLKDRLIGDRAFYKMVIAIVMPIIIQQAITNFVGLLDNIMVGQIGTEQMSGVSISNQLLMVFNLCIFGGLSGAGIFAAQFHGAGNHKGVRHCFIFKVYLVIGLVLLAFLIFIVGGKTLIMQYLHDESATEQIAATLNYGYDYLMIMLWGLPAFALAQVYAGTLRETGETALPMRAGISAVFVNLVFNYLLIYGKLGFPIMGVKGAALATVLSRYVELAIIAYSAHTHPEKFPFIHGVYSNWKLPRKLVKDITLKGMPLLVNEALWSMGVAMLTQCYSVRGLNVVAALNISTTVSNLFNVVFLSMGNAAAIIIGQSLGANEKDRAMDQAWKMLTFSVITCVGMGVALAIAAPFIPLIYRTTTEVRRLATYLLLVHALCMPLFAYANCAYFTLRSGGKTMITFVFDCVFSWTISVPIAWCLVHFTGMSIIAVYFCVQAADIIKCIFGYILIKKGIWVNNMVG